MSNPEIGEVFLLGRLQVEIARDALVETGLNPMAEGQLTQQLIGYDMADDDVKELLVPIVCFEVDPTDEDAQIKADVLASLRQVIQNPSSRSDTIVAAEALLEGLET
jgi:hypothetical protein